MDRISESANRQRNRELANKSFIKLLTAQLVVLGTFLLCLILFGMLI